MHQQCWKQVKTALSLQIPGSLKLHDSTMSPAPKEPFGWSQVQIELQPARISIVIGSHAILTGQLFAKIKCEESTWYISEGVATLTLLKANRRGNYADGCNNAHTFWRALLKSEPQNQTLKVRHRTPLSAF